MNAAARTTHPTEASPPLSPPLPDASRERRASPVLGDADARELQRWLEGRLALPRERARHLLSLCLESGAGPADRGLYVAAVKAIAAGETNWPEMGLRLTLN